MTKRSVKIVRYHDDDDGDEDGDEAGDEDGDEDSDCDGTDDFVTNLYGHGLHLSLWNL